MNLWIKILVKLRGVMIGKDAYGNTYYEEKKPWRLKKRRWVLYKGYEEATKVPPLWHAWLHYVCDDIPSFENESYAWEKGHLPNLTGTPLAHNPLKFKNKENNTAWTPPSS